MGKLPACAASLLLVTWSGGLHAQVDPSRYPPGTIQAVIDSSRDGILNRSPAGVTNWVISAYSFPRRSRVVFSGERRPLDSLRLQVIRQWGWGIQHDSTIASHYTHEYLFREGTQELWLAVQTILEPDIAQELKPGDPVVLFVVWFGACAKDGVITWVFSVNDFDAGR